MQCADKLFEGSFMSSCPLCRKSWERMLSRWEGHCINRSYSHTLESVLKLLPNANLKTIGLTIKELEQASNSNTHIIKCNCLKNFIDSSNVSSGSDTATNSSFEISGNSFDLTDTDNPE